LPHPPTIPITFKLTPTESDELSRVVNVGQFDSRSSAIRAALQLLWEKHGSLKQTDVQIERERRVHPPRASKHAAKPVVKPVVKPLAKAKAKMSATRARKSSV